ncbi:MAG TPA: hypothetical protein VIM83_05315, partial [Candidatus Limnocylindria bacterium]
PGVATKLQILATEHWSLLATRSLTYTESLGRVSVFLAILSGAVIALALVAQADHFGPAFIAIAIFLLSVVLFTGMATIARLNQLNGDDYRWVLGMNRLRKRTSRCIRSSNRTSSPARTTTCPARSGRSAST